MKCENCGKNEVTFVYRGNINGNVEEAHLCADCAEKLGYTQRIAARGRRMMEDFFGGNLLDEVFTPSLFGRMGRLMEDPFDDFFADMPALTAGETRDTREEERKANLVDAPEQSRFAHMRQLNALRLEMKRAVHSEDFERAAELRDQIKTLEQEEKERREGA